MIGTVKPAPLYDKIADMERAFRFNGVTLTRQDYESMPCSMFATELSDKVMQKIAKETYEWLISNGWEDAQISKYLGDDVGKMRHKSNEAYAIEADYWKFMEKAAIENGMRYYEDIGEE